MDICQERGHAGRCPGALPETYSYKLCFSLESFLYNFKRRMNPTKKVLCPEYRNHQLTDLMDVSSLPAPKLCYNSKTERMIGNPDVETGLVEACGACTNSGRKKEYHTISIDLTGNMIFDLFITEDHTIDGDHTFKNVLQSIMNYQSVNDVLFRSNHTDVDPVKIKNMLFLLIGLLIVTLKYRLDDNEILFNLGKSYNVNLILALNDPKYWLNIDNK